ncbi:hypothetical protein EBR66_03160 [bacterium]|nr:hypothetical protein [bacterium]
MIETTVRHLLHDLEKTIHERLEAVDSLLQRHAESSRDPTTLHADQALLARIENLEKEIQDLRSQKRVSPDIPDLIPLHPLNGIEIVPKKEVVVSDPNPERISVADRLLLNTTARRALEEEEEVEEEVEDMYNERDIFVEESEEEEEESEYEKEETEVEEKQEEQEETVDESKEAEEDREEEEELEEFEYKGSTYYRDAEKNVYMSDETGSLHLIGIWSDVKAKIIVKKAVA